MDKELLRVVIILIGLLVMIGMVLWHFLKSLRENRAEDDYADHEEQAESQPYSFDNEDDDLDIFPGEMREENLLQQDERNARKPPRFNETVAPIELPQLIELRIVARGEPGFNGVPLFEALEKQGLEFGDVKVFERLDANRMVDFTVASMLKPGTFPEYELEDFFCPGIVFYMQPRELEYPLQVFDDLMDTIDNIADELDGDVQDHRGQILTADAVDHYRQLFAHS
jgi:cell division protein ZipA